MKKYILWLAAFLAVLIVFQVCYGLQIIWPKNVSWLMTVNDDWGTHYLGWFFYRNEPWHFPIGHISGYYFPIGTNVGFTDSIPLLAVFFKLFSSLLPPDFQYFGIWLLLCHLLAGYYTIKLFRLFHVRPLFTFLAVIFIVANPVLVYRGMHPALCAQWMLIASLYIYFLNPAEAKAKKILLSQFILFMVATLVNPYIAFMVFGFTFFIALKIFFFDKAIQKKYFYLYIAGCILSALLSWYIIGMIDFKGKEDLGVGGAYGLYSLNLNALYNPGSFSSFLPALKQVSWHQFEGYMYLGMGIFILLLVLMLNALYHYFRQREKSRRTMLVLNNTKLLPLLIWIVLLTLFSLTQNISLNDKILFTIPIPPVLIKLGDIFRASARFFWTPYYCIILFSIIGVTRLKLNKTVILSILLIATSIQLYDTKPILTFRHLSAGSYEPPLDKGWTELMKQFDNIAFYPPFESHQRTKMDYQYFCYLAAQLKKPINIGYVARSDNRAMQLYEDSLAGGLEDGILSPSTLYITTWPYLNHFNLAIRTDSARLNALDGYYYLYSKSKKNEQLDILSNTLNLKNQESLDSALNISREKTVFTETGSIPTPTGNKPIQYWITRIHNGEKSISVEGWAFIDSSDNNKGDSIFITLSSPGKYYIAPSGIQSRPDITSHFHRSYLGDAGFKALAFFDTVVQKGTYRLGLAIKNAQGQMVYQPDETIVRANLPLYPVPEKISRMPDTGRIVYGLDPLESDGPLIKIGGWAALENQDAGGSKISLVLKGRENNYLCPVDPVLRPDVTSHFDNKYKLDSTGFKVQLLKNSLRKGHYQIGIRINNPQQNKDCMILTDMEVEIP